MPKSRFEKIALKVVKLQQHIKKSLCIYLQIKITPVNGSHSLVYIYRMSSLFAQSGNSIKENVTYTLYASKSYGINGSQITI